MIIRRHVLARTSSALAALVMVLTCACSIRGPADVGDCQAPATDASSSGDLLQLLGLDPEGRFLGQTRPGQFTDLYFRAFVRHEEPLTTKRWAWHAYDDGSLLLDDLQPATHAWFVALDEEAAWSEVDSINRPGITLATTSLRAMPSSRAVIGNPEVPGQGLDFDLLQNALVNANEPLWLSHRSRSGDWTFLFTSYASGWILSRDVAALPEGQEIGWSLMAQAACVIDGYPIQDHQGRMLFSSRIGMILPLVEQHTEGTRVRVATSRGPEGDARFEVVSLPPGVAEPIPSAPTLQNIADVAVRLLGQPYGWGGLNDHRDCSSVLRDLFMPFGLWLPRNSREQVGMGNFTDLSGLSENEKTDLILEHGVPFTTLLYKRGHIALYVGHLDGVPMVFHSVWALTSGHGERHLIGRVVLSALRPAETPCADSSTLLASLEAMSVLSSSGRG